VVHDATSVALHSVAALGSLLGRRLSSSRAVASEAWPWHRGSHRRRSARSSRASPRRLLREKRSKGENILAWGGVGNGILGRRSTLWDGEVLMERCSWWRDSADHRHNSEVQSER
jgi:hypothetical protein